MKHKILIPILLVLVIITVCFLPLIFTNNKEHKILEETKHYKITYKDSMYYYYIFDKNNNIVRTDGPLNIKPNIMVIDDNLICFTLQSGTGIVTQWGYYYDINKNIFSQTFHSIYDQSNGKIAYGGLNKIIISDIFDSNKYYLEIDKFDNPLAKVAAPILSVEFTNNGTSINVSYLTGSDYKETTQNVKLTQLIR